MAPIHQYESLLENFHKSASQNLVEAISIAMANKLHNFDMDEEKNTTNSKEYLLYHNSSILLHLVLSCSSMTTLVELSFAHSTG